ncbi:DUF934 domain-containing protein [Aquirhabdus sp.]|uniref:DUF934 domain-containing protein n=1 Tax=Aquirhabdus sp. TaxID=2824160 RepID=UPI00396C62C7
MPNNQTPNLVLNLAGDSALDTFQRIAEDGVLPSGDVTVSLAQIERLAEISGKKGLVLTEKDSPETTSLPLADLDLIEIYFPAFADGRGYSFATLLRRQGFKGELRATGDVFKDVLFYLKRVGFDSFILKQGKDINEAKAGLHDFTSGYQASTAEPQAHYQAGR